MKKILSSAIISCLTFVAFSQEKTFKITFPLNWIQFQRQDVIKSVNEKIQLSDSARKDILAKGNGSTQLYGYTAPNKSGVLYRPNIQVLLRRNLTNNNEQFKITIEQSLKDFVTKINDFKIVEKLSEVKIGGKSAIYVKVSGFLNTKSGDKASFYSRIYAIPDGDVFYQITMNDTEEYDCEKDFAKVLASIEF